MIQLTEKELIEKLANEIGRLQRLCRENNIDPIPKGGNMATMKVNATVNIVK